MVPYQKIRDLFPTLYYCSLSFIFTASVTTPYLRLKCLPIVSFVLSANSIALPLTLQQTVLELRARPVNLVGLILFYKLLPF
jgi:hypothetical protein